MSTQVSPAQAGFQSFRLGVNVQRGITAAGYEQPRPIQTAVIPAVLEGRDVLGLAQTGTGKTAAFALPILEILQGKPRSGPHVLVLAPTRELAAQIHSDMVALGRFAGIRAVTIFGGVSMSGQIRALRAQPDIVIACPGRLLDLYEQRLIRLDGIEIVVLDEADHMFDMGFLPSVRRILAAVPRERQTLMFSATMPKEIRQLADGILRKPKVVELNVSEPLSTIEHALYPVPTQHKLELLERLMAEDEFTSGIVFIRTKHRAQRVAEQLARKGHKAVALQGNMSQGQRDRAMNGFRAGQFKVLIATDLAARGLDIAHVSHVINFDMPNTPDAYTHRIGRTGRAERSGKAYTFITNEDAAAVRTLERQLGKPIRRCIVRGFEGVDVRPAEQQKAAARIPANRKAPAVGPAVRSQPRSQPATWRQFRAAPRRNSRAFSRA